MRPFALLLALVPCAVLAAQDAPEAPVTTGEQAAPAPAETPPLPPLSTSSPAPAADPAAVVVPAPEALPAPPPPPPTAAPFPRWGLFLGAGVPEAVTLSLIYRPVPLVRLHAGPSWGYLKFGYHGGVTLTPIRWAVSPTLGVEAGRFSSIDVTRAAKNADAGVKDLLRNVDYTYAAALLGFEFGSQRGFAFDLRLGMTWLKVDSHGTGTFTGSGGVVNGGTATNDATISVTNPALRASGPTVQLGFQYFF